jgi:hypothetical protein
MEAFFLAIGLIFLIISFAFLVGVLSIIIVFIKDKLYIEALIFSFLGVALGVIINFGIVYLYAIGV